MSILSKNNHVKSDPFAQREAEKYDNPIPSREYILSLLDAADGPVTHPELCEQLKLTDEDSIEALRRRLIAMARDGQLISERRGERQGVEWGREGGGGGGERTQRRDD